jgi:hypothetical protein
LPPVEAPDPANAGKPGGKPTDKAAPAKPAAKK